MRITAVQKTNGSITTDSTEIANELTENYASNSSDTNYDGDFFANKLGNETISDPRFKEDKNLIINSPLLLTEHLSLRMILVPVRIEYRISSCKTYHRNL